MTAEARQARPAFYALARGGWRDYVTLLHPPYTAWHLSFVAIGAGLAPDLHLGRLAAALGAFFLAVGVGAHALDEVAGRPLETRIPAATLWALAGGSIGGAVAIGVVGALTFAPWLGAFVGFGAFIVVAYNLELLGGRFHSDVWFALSWGAFPLLAGYFACAETLRPAAIVAAAFAALTSYAQRRLSWRARSIRRRAVAISGTIVDREGREEPVTSETVVGAAEDALQALALACVLLAVALVLAH
jgi:hypothetical protein